MVVKWTFNDGVGGNYSFEINPNKHNEEWRKRVQTSTTLAPDGQTIITEGRDEPRSLNFSGALLSADQHNKFVEWFNKRRQIQVTDDLNRTFTIYITGYSAERLHRRSHLHRREYTIDAVIIAE